MGLALLLLYVVFTLIVLYRALPAIVWDVGTVVYFVVHAILFGWPSALGWLGWSVLSFIVVLNHVDVVRGFLSRLLFLRAKTSMPKLSTTEEEALNAGDTWFEASIFRGTPDWAGLEKVDSKLTQEEQDFLQNETEQLCAMLHEWEIKTAHDLPKPVWKFLKDKGFLGLVIAKQYGGKGFSARAHSEIVMKISSRSGVAAVTVMVPNSLGPGELLYHYGTTAQKDYYLPRLAKGLEIPCFALTEPGAGSDATSIQSEAIVMEQKVDGKMVLGLKISMNKRWITLAPVATLIGVAVQLKDPNGLLKGVGQEGITCVLMPRNTKNLEIGHRHLPADQCFMNGTIRGDDLFLPIDCIIGGQANAGTGWRMLVECLSIGRSISLPALGVASSHVAYVATGAYSRIRRQFNVEIGQFEGVEEKLAEIAGLNYLVEATRILTLAAVDAGKKPSVVSAITKYFNTELARVVINSAMDVHGGRAVVEGPRNYLSPYYHSLPISITVEGANIMTRNLLIFGQGSMACHPFVREEFYAVSKGDAKRFHELLWQHIQYFMQNFAKSIVSAWTGGRLIRVPKHSLKRSYQKLTRLSHALAWISDLMLIVLGGSLKRKERLSARLADGLSYLYLAMAVLRFAQSQGESDEPKYHAQWALSYCFYHAQKAMLDLCHNFPIPGVGWLVRVLVFPWGQSMRYPSDRLDNQLARQMMNHNEFRNRVCGAIYLSGDPTEPLDRMEHAFQLLIQHRDLYKKVQELKRYNWNDIQTVLDEKVKEGIITQEEQFILLAIEKARWDAIQVDEFKMDDLTTSVIDKMKTPFNPC